MATPRPTEYTTAIAVEICTRLVEGKSLTAICKQPGMPRVGAVYAWLASKPDFQQLYATAKFDQADTYGSMALDVANEPTADSTAVQRNRLRVDTLKWMAAVQRPSRYGAKVAIGGAEDLPPIQVDELEGAKRLAFILARAGHLISREEAAASPAIERPPVAVKPATSWSLTWPPRHEAEAIPLDSIEDKEEREELDRIGDPLREPPKVDSGPGRPLSARRHQQPSKPN